MESFACACSEVASLPNFSKSPSSSSSSCSVNSPDCSCDLSVKEYSNARFLSTHTHQGIAALWCICNDEHHLVMAAPCASKTLRICKHV